MSSPTDKSIMHSLGAFVGHVVKGIRTDPAAKKDKWQDTAVQGFWAGRSIDCVLRGVRYSCKFFDGVRFRVVVYNFRVHVHKFINLTPNGNKLLPDWPHFAAGRDACRR